MFILLITEHWFLDRTNKIVFNYYSKWSINLSKGKELAHL